MAKPDSRLAVVLIAGLQLTACGGLPHAGSPANRSADDGVVVYSKLPRDSARTRLWAYLKSSGYDVDPGRSTSSTVSTSPKPAAGRQLVVVVQLMPSQYPPGYQTVLVFAGLYSDLPTVRPSRRVRPGAEPTLWAEVKSLAAGYRDSEGQWY